MIAFAADLHIGNHRAVGNEPDDRVISIGMNRQCRKRLVVLEHALDVATEQKVDGFVFCGDLFDTPKPAPQMLAAVKDLLEQHTYPKVLIVGNHDAASEQISDHALDVLAGDTTLTTVVDTPRRIRLGAAEVLAMPYRREFADVDRVIYKFPKQCNHQGRAVAMHAGIITGATPRMLRSAPDAAPTEKIATWGTRAVSAVFAGHWHDSAWTDTASMDIIQVGALAPVSFRDSSEDDSYGWLWLWSYEPQVDWTIKRVRIPGPRYVKIGPDDIPQYVLNLEYNCATYAAITARRDQLEQAREMRTLFYRARIRQAPTTNKAVPSRKRKATTAKSALKAWIRDRCVDDPDTQKRACEYAQTQLEKAHADNQG